jgi:hypothetical protein
VRRRRGRVGQAGLTRAPAETLAGGGQALGAEAHRAADGRARVGRPADRAAAEVRTCGAGAGRLPALVGRTATSISRAHARMASPRHPPVIYHGDIRVCVVVCAHQAKVAQRPHTHPLSRLRGSSRSCIWTPVLYDSTLYSMPRPSSLSFARDRPQPGVLPDHRLPPGPDADPLDGHAERVLDPLGVPPAVLRQLAVAPDLLDRRLPAGQRRVLHVDAREQVEVGREARERRAVDVVRGRDAQLGEAVENVELRARVSAGAPRARGRAPW